MMRLRLNQRYGRRQERYGRKTGLSEVRRAQNPYVLAARGVEMGRFIVAAY